MASAEVKEVAEELLFDKRIRERHVKAGLIVESDVQKQLEALPDLTEQAEFTDLDTFVHNHYTELENRRG